MHVVASCSVCVRERSELREQSFVRESGEPWAWLYVGEDAEVSIYGTPAAMRRLGAALVATADAADRLASEHVHGDEAATAAAAYRPLIVHVTRWRELGLELEDARQEALLALFQACLSRCARTASITPAR